MELIEWLGESNKLGQDIWDKKYKYENETFDDWLNRVSNGDEKLKHMIINKEFIFGGRILSNRCLQDKGKKVTMSNCYVISPPEDSIESIFETASKLARTFSYGGGCGIDISKLRPRGAKVNNTAKYTSGAVSFMDLYSLTTEIIGQNGRRGALMISIDVEHPDVEEFIKVKSDLNRITKANISIRVNERFMKAVKENKKYTHSYTIESNGEVITHEINAPKLWQELCYQNWNYAEPGILFWDNIEHWNLLSEDKEFEYAGTNPCAEEPLPAGGSCLLGSIILPTFVENGEFNFKRFEKVVAYSVKALNDVLDEGIPLHPLDEQRKSVKDWRQIGLGVLGVGDMLIKLGLTYGSDESLDFCNNLSKILVNSALLESSKLAKKYGTYPKYKSSCIEKSLFLIENASTETMNHIKKYGLRNSQLLTIAPTGSIGTMLEISTGIEPNFAFSYTRKTESLHGEDKTYKIFTKIAKDYMSKNNIKDEKDLPNYFVTAQNLNPYDRVKMQGIWQKRIDASISSTVNLVNSTTIEDVSKLYLLAYDNNLKGMTIYRSGCAREGILITKDNSNNESISQEVRRGKMSKVPDDTYYIPKDMYHGCGKAKVMIGYSPSQKRCVDVYYINKGRGGCSKNTQGEAILISQILRIGGDLKDIQKSFLGIDACTSCTMSRMKGNRVDGINCPNILLNLVISTEREYQNKECINDTSPVNTFVDTTSKTTNETICPICKTELEISGGCYTCRFCGYSKCD